MILLSCLVVRGDAVGVVRVVRVDLRSTDQSGAVILPVAYPWMCVLGVAHVRLAVFRLAVFQMAVSVTGGLLERKTLVR